MTEKRFAVVFSGQIVDGADAAQVRKNLANLFNVEVKKVEAMFSGKPVLIKNNLDEAKARGYQTALAKAGAVVELAATKSPSGSTSESAARPKAAPPTTPAAKKESAPPAPPQAPDLTIAEVCATLVEYKEVPPTDFDTTQFDLAEVGATLVEYGAVPPAVFDTSGMELAPPGEQLVEHKTVPPAEYDTSGLSLVENQ